MKRMQSIEKDFIDTEVYDIGVKDIYGNKFYIAVNIITNHIRFISKYKDYNKRRRSLDKLNLEHVHIQKYGDVIDILGDTYSCIMKMFPDTILPIECNLSLW